MDSGLFTIEIIEHEGDFLEMRDFDRPRDTGWNSVETITERSEIGRSPGLTCQTAISDEDFIAKVCSAVTVVSAVWSRQ